MVNYNANVISIESYKNSNINEPIFHVGIAFSSKEEHGS